MGVRMSMRVPCLVVVMGSLGLDLFVREDGKAGSEHTRLQAGKCLRKFKVAKSFQKSGDNDHFIMIHSLHL